MPRILVVEDPLTMMQLSGPLMDIPSLEFHTAANGREALERISNAPGSYDLVAIGDGVLEMTLTECLAYLKRMFQELLILVMVADDGDDTMRELNNLGIRRAQVITKPTTPEHLAIMVQGMLEEDRRKTIEKRKRKQEGGGGGQQPST